MTKYTDAKLAEIAGKATAHTFTRLDQIERHFAEAEAAMDRAGLAKKHRAGATLVLVSGGTFSKAYQRKSRFYVATRVIAARGKSGWTINSVERCEMWTSTGGFRRMDLTDNQREIIARVATDRVVNF